MNRALPGPIIDLIRDGITLADMKAGGDRAVWKALVRTAASASQRGQSWEEWESLLGESRSRLGAQARLKRGRKERTSRDYHRTLISAWTTATKWLTPAPPRLDAEQIRERANTVEAFIADAETPLPDSHRAILACAVEVARRNGTTRPALPRRELQKATGLGERTLRTALDALHQSGLLHLEVPGRASGNLDRRRANLYQLPTVEALDAYLYRGTRSMGPQAQVYGTPPVSPNGTPLQIYGTPTADSEGHHMVTLTLSAASPQALAAALDALQRRGEVQIAPPVVDGNETNVVPIRRASSSLSDPHRMTGND